MRDKSSLTLFFKEYGKRLLDIGILIFGDLISLIFTFEQIYLVHPIVDDSSHPLPTGLKVCVLCVLSVLITLKLIIEISEFLKDLKCPR